MKLQGSVNRKMTLSSNSPLGGTASTNFLPSKVTQIPPDALRTYPHTKRVGHYLLGRTLGEGSFAKVKEGLHTLTGEKVAIKVIDKKKAKEDAYVRKNLRREGKLLQMVRHRNVVHLLEIMETENSYYLVTELCRGGDLMDHICSKKRLEERETRKFIRQIISAVDYLHKTGILHRDLKVENLLLDEHRDIKIIDFGLSNCVRVSHTKEGSTMQEFCVTQCGSPAYAAPELLGNKKYGPKVDIWSVGVNMYAMLTGNLPFTVEPFNIKALHNKMLKGEMTPLPDSISKNCKDLLTKFLTADPDKRITLQDAMAHPWITEGRNRPIEPAPFPNKLCADNITQNIVKHMCQKLDFKMGEVIRLVTANIPSSCTATYNLFNQRLKKFTVETKVTGRTTTTTSKVANEKNSSTGHKQVIDLLPVKGRDAATKSKGHPENVAPPSHMEPTKLSPDPAIEGNGRPGFRNMRMLKRREQKTTATSLSKDEENRKPTMDSSQTDDSGYEEMKLVKLPNEAKDHKLLSPKKPPGEKTMNLDTDRDREPSHDMPPSSDFPPIGKSCSCRNEHCKSRHENRASVPMSAQDDFVNNNVTKIVSPDGKENVKTPRLSLLPPNKRHTSFPVPDSSNSSVSMSEGHCNSSGLSAMAQSSQKDTAMRKSGGLGEPPVKLGDSRNFKPGTLRQQPKKVLLDIAHYDRFARQGSSMESEFTRLSPTLNRSGIRGRKPLSLYPMYNDKSRPVPRRSLNSQQLQNNSGCVLNITGEKAMPTSRLNASTTGDFPGTKARKCSAEEVQFMDLNLKTVSSSEASVPQSGHMVALPVIASSSTSPKQHKS